MKLITLLFSLLFVLTQVSYAQTKPLGKNSTDEDILQRADQIRYQALYQDYSNIATALANSTLEVSDRIPTLKRLSEAYLFKQPANVSLPSNLLRPDGSIMSDKEMTEFVNQLTKVPAKATRMKSNDYTTACFVRFFNDVHSGDPNNLIVHGWIIVYPPQMGNIPECAQVPVFSAAPVTVASGK